MAKGKGKNKAGKTRSIGWSFRETAFLHAPAGMAVINPDGRCVEVNGALCELLGRDEAELARRESDRGRPPRRPGSRSRQLARTS